MGDIKKIFDEIAKETSTNSKMDILRKYSKSETLKRVLYLANSKRIKFYIKQIPNYTTNTKNPKDINWALDNLSFLSDRIFTGNEAIKWLQNILSSISKDDAYIIERIIEKDCKIGMGSTNINKIFKNLIEETPYMGSKSYDPELIKKIFNENDYCFSQIKMDGRYCNAIIRSGEVELESRNGEPTILIGAKFLKELENFDDCVLNGELTMPGFNRYESNGIIASLISIGNKILANKDIKKEILKFEKEHKISYQEALNIIQYTVWDTITVDEYFKGYSDTPYIKRLSNVNNLIKKSNSTKVVLIKSVEVKSINEAMSHFQETLKSGEEGTIIKAKNGKWKDGRQNWQIKVKLEMTVDLKIIGFNYGTKGSKNENVVSSLTCASSDHKVITRPQGLKEKEMDYITKNKEKLLGKIIECKCSGLSKDSDGNYSLLHPVFIKIRDDKNEADDLESILKNESMIKGLNNA